LVIMTIPLRQSLPVRAERALQIVITASQRPTLGGRRIEAARLTLTAYRHGCRNLVRTDTAGDAHELLEL
jgi:hypothetical protein